MDEAEEAVGLGADIVEARVDLAAEAPELFVEGVSRLGKPVILTIRPAWEGGGFKGSDKERALLFRMLLPMADYVDVELRAANVDRVASLAKGSGVSCIVSYHDFTKTPPVEEMAGLLARCREKGDIGKLAVMPRGPEDVLALFEATLEAKKPVCTIAMGDVGMHSRLVAPVYGSILTYGYVRKPVAPGQMRVDEIIEGLKLLRLR